jgi:hypothetical protein
MADPLTPSDLKAAFWSPCGAGRWLAPDGLRIVLEADALNELAAQLARANLRAPQPRPAA